MKIYTSYFYQLRFFQPYMIPLSTALGDPLWYHNSSRNNNVVFKDKRGVINGLRILPLVPDSSCSNLCRGRDNCDPPDPDNCVFLKNYYAQLQKIDFEKFMEDLNDHISTVCAKLSINIDPVVVIMFHESYTNQCSERVVVQRWFAEHGMNITELNPKEY